jgi:Na+/phosphate symporter
MDTITKLGLVGTLLGIIGFFFPVEWKNKFLVKIVFTLIVIVLSVWIINQNSRIRQMEKISKSANLLVEQKSINFTSEGFILAALSFLEQNKSSYPDSYKRAKDIFEVYNKSEHRDINSTYTASEMEGLIVGIGILSTVEDK